MYFTCTRAARGNKVAVLALDYAVARGRKGAVVGSERSKAGYVEGGAAATWRPVCHRKRSLQTALAHRLPAGLVMVVGGVNVPSRRDNTRERRTRGAGLLAP